MESFGFFSKDPKDFEYEFYQVKENNGTIFLKNISLRNMEGYNNYGLSRINRYRLLKMAKLDKKLSYKWESTDRDSLLEHIAKIDSIPMIRAEYGFGNYKNGKYLIIKSKPTDWIWNKYSTKDSLQYALFKFY